MIKKIFVIALSFVASIALVQAQDSWAGLSGNKCVWTSVSSAMVETTKDGKKKLREAWVGCDSGKCAHKFCNGLAQKAADGEILQGAGDKKIFWERNMCNKYCITLQEELPIEGLSVKSISGESGVDLLGNYFGLWYKIGVLVLGLICVLVIVISGVQIIFGGASEESATSAKAQIWGALLSLILLFSSALILKTINPLFFT